MTLIYMQFGGTKEGGIKDTEEIVGDSSAECVNWCISCTK